MTTPATSASTSDGAAEPTRKCTSCAKPASENPTPLKRCAKCKTAYYCDRVCQAADWQRGHKWACSLNKERHERGLAALEGSTGLREDKSPGVVVGGKSLDEMRQALADKYGEGTINVSKVS